MFCRRTGRGGTSALRRALAERGDDRNSLVRIIAADAAREGTAGDARTYVEGALEASRPRNVMGMPAPAVAK